MHQSTKPHTLPPAAPPAAAPTPDAGFNPDPWHTLLNAVRDAFPARLDTPNPSLALTRVLIEACGYLSIHAHPIPVFLDITRAHTHREGGVDERALLTTPTGWTGHLTALADLGAGRHLLLDPTADRFDRPIRNLITGGPLLATTQRPHPAHHLTQPLAHLHHNNDITLTYRTIPTGHPHRDDWRNSHWWQPHTDATRTAIRAATTAAATLPTTFPN